MIIAFEDEPFPSNAIGISKSIKLCDWLELNRSLFDVNLDIRSVSELNGDMPDIVEAFTDKISLLNQSNFPQISEHTVVDDMRTYWGLVEQSGVPAIPVLPSNEVPKNYPVFVRGGIGSFSDGFIESQKKFIELTKDIDSIVRPYVEISTCSSRASVKKELRVHVVCGQAVCVGFLFPLWASQHPTKKEYELGCMWTNSVSNKVAGWAEAVSQLVDCRWFTADFAETPDGTMLVELNPGWCSGVTDKCAARAIHVAILEKGFGISLPFSLLYGPVEGVPYIAKRD